MMALGTSLKSDQNGIETGGQGQRWLLLAPLKSDQNGIETDTFKELCHSDITLKSDQNGIETPTAGWPADSESTKLKSDQNGIETSIRELMDDEAHG